MTAAKRHALRRGLLRSVRREHREQRRIAELFSGPQPRYGHDPAERIERRAEMRALTSKLGSPEPLFEIQKEGAGLQRDLEGRFSGAALDTRGYARIPVGFRHEGRLVAKPVARHRRRVEPVAE